MGEELTVDDVLADLDDDTEECHHGVSAGLGKPTGRQGNSGLVSE